MIEPTIGAYSGVATVMAFSLAAVFAVAAVVKLLAPGNTANEFAQLGLPAAKGLARLVPLLELAVAAVLIVAPRLGAVASLVALGAFTAVLVRTIRSGRQVSCGCLGSLSREPISWSTVARNVLLASMAVVAMASSSPTIPSFESVVVATTFLSIFVLAIQLLAMQQTIGRVWSVQLAGETVGTPESGGDKR